MQRKTRDFVMEGAAFHDVGYCDGEDILTIIRFMKKRNVTHMSFLGSDGSYNRTNKGVTTARKVLAVVWNELQTYLKEEKPNKIKINGHDARLHRFWTMKLYQREDALIDLGYEVTTDMTSIYIQKL